MKNRKALKIFMLSQFDFGGLKRAGVFPKEMKPNDYVGQAEIICRFFSLKSIYDYADIGKGVRYHISEKVEEVKPSSIGRHQPFVRTIGEDLEGRVVPFRKDDQLKLL